MNGLLATSGDQGMRWEEGCEVLRDTYRTVYDTLVDQ